MRNVGIVDEITLNAVRAALDERVVRLEREVDVSQARQLVSLEWDEDTARAITWAIAALHETKLAQELFAEVRDEPEHPADATVESELRYAWGDR